MSPQRKRAAIYVRVSTDKQTVANQIEALKEIAERRGWQVVETYQDAGVSGAKHRDQRPALDAMLKDACRRRFDVAMVWAIDRLGRSLVSLLDTVKALEDCGCDLFIEKQAIDTTSLHGKLVFHIFGAIAEFERGFITERINAGLARARKHGTKSGNPFGRPRIDATLEKRIRAAIAKGGKGKHKLAAEFGVGSGTIARIKAEMEAA
ncbi:MAG TPA: recombinase family protein [Stellaceae bacterium]|nr:recombinase family protein [Stellaceae bacterium]